MQTYKMTIQYEGTRYKGWQRLKTTDMTIQSKIEQVLTRYFDAPIEISGSGRTDAGVHAQAQVAHFAAPHAVDLKACIEALNRYLPEDIVVRHLEAVSDQFHARFHAVSKVYTYRLWTAPYPPVFERHYVVPIQGPPPNIDKMKQASKLFLGTHDFKAYSTDKTKKSTVRTLTDIAFIQTEQELQIVFTGEGFLYNMVRILVGTLLEIGTGQRTMESIEQVFKSGKRELAGETAPAKGLILTHVHYENI